MNCAGNLSSVPDAPGGSAGEILKARAAALARRSEEQPPHQDALTVVVFRLAQEQYAVEQAHVREVYTLRDLTPFPCTPPFVVGVINVRGEILPVISIGRFFDLPESGINDIHMVIIVRVGEIELGILADAVQGVRTIPLDTVHPPLATMTGIHGNYLKGVSSERIIILDVQRIIADPKAIVDEQVQA